MRICAYAHCVKVLPEVILECSVFLFFCTMPKEKKISVRTPPTLYTKLLQRAYALNLNHREYFLALAIKDLEEEGEGLTEDRAAKLKQRIKDMDREEE